ncbi:MAG: non-heme iron oxygenase ferredoxin subunit [Acidimicrobiia bacterium]
MSDDNWTRVASASDVKPGNVIMVTLGDDPIALAHVDDELLAIGDVCSHEYVLLHDGFVDGDEIECPEHGSKFSLRTGAVRGLPATQPVAAYEVKVEGDDVFLRGPKENN